MNSNSGTSIFSKGYESASLDPRLKFGIELSVTGQRPSKITHLMLREADDRARRAVADVSYRTSVDLQAAQRIEQTIVYGENPSMTLPSVRVIGRTVLSNLVSTMGAFTGLQEVSRDNASLPDALQARSFQPRVAAELFTAEFREVLESCPFPLEDLVINISSKRIAVFRFNKILVDEERVELISFAETVMEAISHRAESLENLEQRVIEEAKQTYRSVSGPLQALIQESPSQQTIDEFLDQDLPRQVPPVIRQQQYGHGSLLVYVVGLVLCALGAALIVMLQSDLPSWGLILIGLLPAAGILAAVLAWRCRVSRKRLLARGECVTALVKNVQSTNAEINGQRRYRVTLDFERTDIPEATVSAYQNAIETAFDLWISEEPTHMLVDPNNHSRVFWIDGTAVL